ncbi:MAG: NUDIX hydrolase [Balneolales bacterium]|nr:NUDIX hydrolase [Balneolales bacterium]
MNSKAFFDKAFTGYVRPRACGLVVWENKILLVKINSPTMPEPIWMPPGGGINYGEKAALTVKREVKEETGLDVRVNKLQFVSEFIRGKWHAIEFYYLCEPVSGSISLGTDPEMPADKQMLQDVVWMPAVDCLNLMYPIFIRPFVNDIVSKKEIQLQFMEQAAN